MWFSVGPTSFFINPHWLSCNHWVATRELGATAQVMKTTQIYMAHQFYCHHIVGKVQNDTIFGRTTTLTSCICKASSLCITSSSLIYKWPGNQWITCDCYFEGDCGPYQETARGKINAVENRAVIEVKWLKEWTAQCKLHQPATPYI